MRKVLVIAYTFPPIPYAGSYRALRLCRGFVEKGMECHVITLKEYHDIPNDYTLLLTVPSAIQVHRVPIVDPWRRYQTIKKNYIGRCWFKYINKVVSFFLRFITFPDHMLFWVPLALYRALRVIKKNNIDTVLVSSPPDSSQLVGWILKKWMKIQWIADFRDPIYGNVAQVNLINPVILLDKVHKKLLMKYDRFIACNADTLIANTETHAGQLQQNYTCTNVQVVRNSFDATEFANVAQEKYPVLTIAHVGSIYGKRNPDLLFAAIKQLASDYAPEPLQLQIIFIGLGGHSLHKNIARYGIEKYVKVNAQVPHNEAIESICRAHLLLLIKATGKWSEGQIPGKFFEYIGSRNRILCIGPKKSEVATLINDYELGYVVEDNVKEMLSVLREVYSQYLQAGTFSILSKEQIKPFSSKVMVEKICNVLE